MAATAEKSVSELAREHRSRMLAAQADRSAFRNAPGGQSAKGWPMVAESLSVSPAEAAEFQADARANGITGVSFDRNGDCTVSDPNQYKAYRRLRGVHFRNAYND